MQNTILQGRRRDKRTCGTIIAGTENARHENMRQLGLNRGEKSGTSYMENQKYDWSCAC